MAAESGNTNPAIENQAETVIDQTEIIVDQVEIVVEPVETIADNAKLREMRRLLEEEPFRVQFFQAVRMLQRIEAPRKPVGYFVTPQGETIRFVSRTSLEFPASEIHQTRRLETGQLEMMVEFMGLNAAISVMPAPYTELLIARAKEKDYAMEDFLNLFNHRMISFFYRGWEKYRFFIAYERTGEDRLSEKLYDVLGLGTEALLGRGGIPDQAYLNYVGLLGRHVRSASSLEQLLEDYFEVPAKVEQFAGAWRKLRHEDQTWMTGAGGLNERLGVGTIAGDEVWDHHGRIRISLGPMCFEKYRSLLPGQSAYHELAAWVRFYSSGSYEAEVQLILVRKDVPFCELGAAGQAGPQLGFVSWLRTQPIDRDPGDTKYLVQ
jgi:type VI secretion system protein ImpH